MNGWNARQTRTAGGDNQQQHMYVVWCIFISFQTFRYFTYITLKDRTEQSKHSVKNLYSEDPWLLNPTKPV